MWTLKSRPGVLDEFGGGRLSGPTPPSCAGLWATNFWMHPIISIVTNTMLSVCEQRLQQGLHPESVQLMSLAVMMEHALNRDIVVTVNIIVLTAPTSLTAVCSLQML